MTSDINRISQEMQDNRLELLLFCLGDRQRFGINVLKVKEIISCPRLRSIPDAHPAVCGVASLRGKTLSVVDLAMAVGRGTARCGQDVEHAGSVIVTEFNRTNQGFLVSQVDRIVVRDWRDVLPPPRGAGGGAYMSGVTRLEDELVQILDVERVLVEVIKQEYDEQLGQISANAESGTAGKRVLVVDDSVMARNQTARTLEAAGISYLMARDGREALDILEKLKDQSEGHHGDIAMVISDIEMPEMDGYTLTREIRKDSELSSLYVLLHTSLNGVINTEQAQLCGANASLTKFVPSELAAQVVKGLGQPA